MRCSALFLLGALTASAFSQIPSPGSPDSNLPLRFQVATIKPSLPEESRALQIRGNRFVTAGTSVIDLLQYAYGLHEAEIAGGPKWLKTQKFDLVADPESQTRPSFDEFKKMVLNLLADRFRLTTHYQSRVLSVFELVPAKGSPKLSKSTRPPNGIPSVGYAPGQLSVANATLADFATFLQRFVADRPVFDRTGIVGRYDLTLRWSLDDWEAEENRPGNSRSSSLPGLFTAIQEQLGLKLQEAKLPAQVLVIDHIDMPSEN